MNQKHLQSWVNTDYVINRLRELTDHKEYLNHINQCINMIGNLQSKLTDTKTEFRCDELNSYYAVLRLHPLTQGFIRIIALLEG